MKIRYGEILLIHARKWGHWSSKGLGFGSEDASFVWGLWKEKKEDWKMYELLITVCVYIYIYLLDYFLTIKVDWFLNLCLAIWLNGLKNAYFKVKKSYSKKSNLFLLQNLNKVCFCNLCLFRNKSFWVDIMDGQEFLWFLCFIFVRSLYQYRHRADYVRGAHFNMGNESNQRDNPSFYIMDIITGFPGIWCPAVISVLPFVHISKP